MPYMTQAERRKLLSLALSSLLSTGSPVVLERVFGIFASVTEVLNDITEQDEDTGAIVEYENNARA